MTEPVYGHAELPLATLHHVKVGEGEPVIIVPATISLIEDWLALVTFVGQKYEAHFFELPGYGESTPLAEGFSSERLAQTIEQFADHLGYERFTLMGFSFGGILTLKALQRLGERVERVVLLSPCVSHEGLRRSRGQLLALKAAIGTLSRPLAKSDVLRLMHDPRTVDALVWFMTEVGGYETNADLRARLLGFSPETLDVLLSQVREVLHVDQGDLAGPFDKPLFFGMSVNDPLLDFRTSLSFVTEQFPDPIVERWDFDYHTPPEPFTLEQLNRDYSALLGAFDE